MRTRPRILTLLIGGVLAVVPAGCGGDDSGDEGGPVSADTDAQAVLDTALGGEGEPTDSGVLDLAFDLQSDRADGVSANAAISGPFQSNGDGALPSVDFDVQASAGAGGPEFAFDGGLTLTPDGLFVGYGGSEYAIDEATFALIEESYAQSVELQAEQEEGGSLSQFGIDPSTWLGEVTNEGEEDLEGSPVVHISGVADVPQILGDLGSVAAQSGQSDQLDPAALQQLQDSVQDASIDVFANADDGSLRQLDLALGVINPTAGGSTDSVTISIGIADPNTEQEISAPADAAPIAELLGRFPDLADSLDAPAPEASPPAVSGGVGGNDPYFECVAAAKTPAEVDGCADLIGSG